ncbi:MAG: hypothetical protein FWC35_01220 [Proteobacteria bacterium]|nr:hypothetical protein [Pseudomonadota bacterium]
MSRNRAHRPDLMTGIEKITDEVRADKTARSGNETLHSVSFFIALLPLPLAGEGWGEGRLG